MSAVIYEQTPGGLYAQPGRAVTTFPSGLVRVDQTYVCATGDAATHRATLAVGEAMPDGNDSPSLETLAIFPEVQGIDRSDGFTEFRVSAYGQTTSASGGTSRTLSGIQLLPAVRPGTAEVSALVHVDIFATVWQITGFVVVPFGESVTLDKIDYDDNLNSAFDFTQSITGSVIPSAKLSDSQYNVTFTTGVHTGVTGLVDLADKYMVVNSYTNFGRFAEVNVTVTRGINSTVIA